MVKWMQNTQKKKNIITIKNKKKENKARRCKVRSIKNQVMKQTEKTSSTEMKRNEIIELRESTIRLCFKSAYFVHPVQRSVISLQYANLGKGHTVLAGQFY